MGLCLGWWLVAGGEGAAHLQKNEQIPVYFICYGFPEWSYFGSLCTGLAVFYCRSELRRQQEPETRENLLTFPFPLLMEHLSCIPPPWEAAVILEEYIHI